MDLHPNGFAQNIVDGIIRARFRESSTKPTLLTPNQVYTFKIDLLSTNYVFEKGHQIRLDISSSNFPRFDRNLNTGNGFAKNETEENIIVATQKVFHKSKLLLPVVKNK